MCSVAFCNVSGKMKWIEIASFVLSWMRIDVFIVITDVETLF